MPKKPKTPANAAPRRARAPTIVKVHEAKTTLSKLLKQVQNGGRVLIANGNREPGFEIIPVQATTATRTARRFGALRGAVTVDAAFFDPLPADELAAWEGK